MDCSAIVLNKLLSEGSLEVWSKLKLSFLDAAYSSVYSAISRHYNRYNGLPSFDELELSTRDSSCTKIIAILRAIDEPDISAEVALDALIDQYTQNLTISLLEEFVDKVTVYDSDEIKENLSSIVLKLDEKTLTTEGVFNMADIMLFADRDEISASRVHLGLNNDFDAILGGVARQELILLGGKRGSGKSITCSNIVLNQYESGSTAVYFTIEMIAREIHERNCAILSGVPYLGLKNGTLSDSDWLKVVKARAEMFEDSGNLVEEYLDHRNRFKFETSLVKEKSLKKDNQIIIIDDRALTLTSIDLHLGKLKARFGNSLTVCVVDYLNQIVVESGGSQFDWQPQIIVSKKLKELARKHDVVMVSPYQIDDNGGTRFAKGILDAADIAVILDAHDKEKCAISGSTTKIRGGPPIDFTSPIDWGTLRISSTPIDKPQTEKPDKIKRVTKTNKNEEGHSDIPWE